MYFAMRSGRLRKYGTYSEKWPLDSVTKRAEVEHHVEADRVLLVDFRVGRAPAQSRVEVFAVLLELREPGVVIDAGAFPIELLVWHLQEVGEQPRRPLDAVAQADDRQRCRRAAAR